MGKAIRTLIPKQTSTRVRRKLCRMLINLSGRKNLERKRYPGFSRDGCSGFMRIYFIGQKSDTRDASRRFFSGLRVTDVPKVIWPDGGAEFEGDVQEFVKGIESIVSSLRPTHRNRTDKQKEARRKRTLQRALLGFKQNLCYMAKILF